MTESAGTRIAWIDIFRGLAIILVVIGHANSPYSDLIYSFHIPAFFFITGYATDLQRGTVARYAASKFDTLIAPFFYMNLALLVAVLIFSAVGTSRPFLDMPVAGDGIVPAVEQLFAQWSAPTSWAGATWFLPALFFASVVARVLGEWSQGSAVRLAQLTVLAAMAIGFFAADPSPLFWNLDLGLFGLTFLLGGALARRVDVFEGRIDHRFMLPLALVAIWSTHGTVWIKVDFPGRTFSPFYQLVFFAICGIYLLWVSSQVVERLPPVRAIVQRIGRDSLWILGFHFVGFKTSIGVLALLGMDVAQAKPLLTPPAGGPWVFCTAFAIAFSLVVAQAFRWGKAVVVRHATA